MQNFSVQAKTDKNIEVTAFQKNLEYTCRVNGINNYIVIEMKIWKSNILRLESLNDTMV